MCDFGFVYHIQSNSICCGPRSEWLLKAWGIEATVVSEKIPETFEPNTEAQFIRQGVLTLATGDEGWEKKKKDYIW